MPLTSREAACAGDFLQGIEQVSGIRRVTVLLAAGVLAGMVLHALRRLSANSVGELSEAVWNKSGRMPAIPTLVSAVLSIVIVGMGVALGREGALKQASGVVAGKLSDWTQLTPPQRHLLVACGAGAGMAAAYHVPLGGALFAVEGVRLRSKPHRCRCGKDGGCGNRYLRGIGDAYRRIYRERVGGARRAAARQVP